VVDRDEFIREGVQVASLAGLKPAFKKEGGTVPPATRLASMTARPRSC
jgi:acetyl-CoA acetyltransferase